jgi:hypothetical protein
MFPTVIQIFSTGRKGASPRSKQASDEKLEGGAVAGEVAFGSDRGSCVPDEFCARQGPKWASRSYPELLDFETYAQWLAFDV